MKIAFIPFAGALTEAAGTITEKKILKQREINYKDYNVFSFLAIILIMIPIIALLGSSFPNMFSFNIQKEALEFQNLALMAGVIIFSILANLLVFYAMKWEKITEIEPIRLFQPLFVIALAFLFYNSERNTGTPILIAATIASLSLIFSHVKKEHFKLNKYGLAALVGSLFFAIELVLSKTILQFYSPIAFYFVRCLCIFVIGYLIFIPDTRNFTPKTWYLTFATGAIWVLYRILLYNSYDLNGMIVTTLLFILSPVFIYLFSYIFLRERPSRRNIISAVIIVACVAYAMFFGN